MSRPRIVKLAGLGIFLVGAVVSLYGVHYLPTILFIAGAGLSGYGWGWQDAVDAVNLRGIRRDGTIDPSLDRRERDLP